MYCRAPLDYLTLIRTEQRWDLQCRIKSGPAYKIGELAQRLAEVERQLTAQGVRLQ